MNKKVKNRVLIDLFPPYGKPEIYIEGSVAQVVAVIIAVAVAARILIPAI